MRRQVGYLVAIGATVLLMAVVLLLGGGQIPTEAIDQRPGSDSQLPTAGSQLQGRFGEPPQLAPDPAQTLSLTQATTITLPIIIRGYPVRRGPFGIIMYGAVSDTAGLPEMAAAGAEWATTMMTWSTIEPSKGVYNWDSFDQKAQNTGAAGMDLYVLFTGNPSWAAELPGGPVTDTQDLVDFVTVAAERYDCDGFNDAPDSPCLHSWSFYAEPDNGSLAYAENRGWGYWGHDGAGYADMLSHVSPAIRSADPKAKVFIGGLAYTWFEDEGGPFVRSFLPDVLDALATLGGADKYIDGVPFHFYAVDPALTITGKAADILAVMSSHGASGLSILCPETGFPSSPNQGSSDLIQAQRLVQIFTRGMSVEMELVSWYKVFDDVEAGSAEDLYFTQTSGLLRLDGSPKPAYHAFQVMTQELHGYKYLRPFVSSGIEGYVFVRSGKEKTVLWSQAGTANATFPYASLRLVQTDGTAVQILDSQAGDLDTVAGQITIAVHDNAPVYVERQ